MIATLLVSLLAVTLPQPQAGVWRWSLPAWSRATVEKAEEQLGVVLSDRLNPYYLQGDFNGDGKADPAVLVRNPKVGKDGVLVVFRDQSKPLLIGAGSDFASHGDDFSWMDVWSVFPRGQVDQGVGEGKPPRLRGDALLVEKSESASALLFWDGNTFRWYQQGD